MSDFETPETRLLRSGVEVSYSFDTAEMTSWRVLVEEHLRRRSLVGKTVEVTLDNSSGHRKVATGRLLGFGTDGQFELLDESDDSIHYCWPMLSIEEVI